MGKNKIYELTDINTKYVSLVTAGANRQRKFLIVKADASKMVPPADADNETKRRALEERMVEYGVEVRPSAALSYPEGFPTVENMYGDPVNLKYPLGGENNEVDMDRLRNALARFKQNYSEYQEGRSIATAYGRIVTAALDAGIDVSYDENDPVDKLLPKEVQDRLIEMGAAKDAAAVKGANETDMSGWLATFGKRLERIDLGALGERIAAKMAAATPVVKAAVEVPQAPSPAEEAVAKAEAECDVLRQEVATLGKQLREANTRMERMRAAEVGVAKSLQAYPVSGTTQNAKEPDRFAKAIFTGGDIAKALTEEKK